ncbi:DUF748 domain-containing protein [Sphaerotilus mobilis]|uniref:Uncharacterized protein DUF748 n=1 Tax=Sphaerotilus mobilis TaxID=47994 RepID=A0A4Q7LIT7_9BURK|nr:DUF748 domain-containing protein [Sphaerotilus mobilis]RZS54396.1 uncharacterized protein DUF748 [Sphaerotilus mobilis]
MTDTPATTTRTPTLSRPWRRLLITAASLAAVAVLWTVLIGVWLPGFVKDKAEAAARDALGVPVTIERIGIAPWQVALTVEGLRIGTAEAPVATLGRLQADVAVRQSLWLRAPVIERLTIEAPAVNVERLDAQRFNFSPIVDRLRERAAAEPPQPAGDAARFALHNLTLADGALRYRDGRDAARPIEHRVEALRLALPMLSNLPADVATEVQPLIEARIDGSSLRLGGEAKPFVPERPADLALAWREIQLAEWLSLLQAVLPPSLAPSSLKGSVSTDLTVAFEARPAPQPPELRVRGQLAIDGFALALPGLGVDAAWQQMRIEAIDTQPLAARHAIGRVAFDGLTLDLVRQPVTDPAAADKPVAAATPASAASAASQAVSAEPAPPLAWQLDAFTCRGCAIHLRDDTQQPPVRLALDELALTLQKLAQPAAAPWTFDLATRVLAASGATRAASAKDSANGGRLMLKGDISGLLPPASATAATAATSSAPAVPLAVQAQIEIEALDLQALQAYLDPYVNLQLIGARVSTQGQLKLSAPASPLADPAAMKALDASYAGRFSLDGLQTQDSVTGAEFVRWRRFGLDGLSARWQGAAAAGRGQLDADFGRIGLDGLQARVILHPDAHLNLADIVKRERGAAAQSITTPQGAASATVPKPDLVGPTAGPVLNLRWQGVTLRDGGVFFTDNFIKPNYSARLTQLKGELSALSSAAPEPARLSLTGALDDGAPLRIAGRVHPLGARLSTDIEASARGIALTRMSTYAERYAGYAIEKGSMSVSVRYQIEQGQLQAENQLFLDQLTFGDKVDSPDATSLPVRLAVALLKDKNGVIDIRMPVSGTLDDPQFSVGGVIWKVVVNLIEKAVTAPFAMLFGGDSNEASALAFAPGSAELDDAGRERLDALAQRLIDKPALKLEATGRADPALDGAAIQAAHVEALKAQAMKAEAMKAEGTKAAAGAARVAAAPALAASAASAVSAASAASAATAPIPPLEPAELERALRTLADARGDRVLAHLAAKLPAERVLLNRSQLTAERPSGDSGPTTRVQFELR